MTQKTSSEGVRTSEERLIDESVEAAQNIENADLEESTVGYTKFFTSVHSKVGFLYNLLFTELNDLKDTVSTLVFGDKSLSHGEITSIKREGKGAVRIEFSFKGESVTDTFFLPINVKPRDISRSEYPIIQFIEYLDMDMDELVKIEGKTVPVVMYDKSSSVLSQGEYPRIFLPKSGLLASLRHSIVNYQRRHHLS